ncbi:chemotaxis protein CheY [Candidatus Nitromaritima sp. SCGC AAA799-A02]|nr:chemotaxis protein CheY [Candidatus Nitromaritima sp. SCGC AAA799-A02]KMP12198.1 chemotaxis protein CheY [Candidatus Nitromaritima sp. SCGC AAA799-C22]
MANSAENLSSKKKILIADDFERIRELVAETLGYDQYQLLESSNAAQAIEVAEREIPDIIIMDVMMPGEIDGVEATRILKNNVKTRNCYIVLLTAKGQAVDREKGLEAGADCYFVKPFSPIELIDKVEEILKNQN